MRAKVEVILVAFLITGVSWTLFGVTRSATAVQKDQARGPDRVERLLEELTGAPGPSGFEGPVRDIVTREFRAAALEVSNDGLGSVIGVWRGSAAESAGASPPRIMLAAHLDEVGAMVRYIMPGGWVKFQLLGGWLDQNLVDQRWVILTAKGPVEAISGQRSPHITPGDDRNRVTPRDDVFLDVGARSEEEAKTLGIRPGDPIVPVGNLVRLSGNRYAAKAMDDRVGCVMMLETLRRLKEQSAALPNTLYFVGTVQEEVGLHGARTAAALVKPDIGISLEAGVAADHPGGRPEMAQEKLGEGPVVYLHDSAMLVNLKLRDFFLRAATDNNIPVQTEVMTGGAEDSFEMQMFDGGRPSLNFAVATRYLHAHNSVIDRGDLDHAIDLLVKILPRLDAKTVGEISKF